MNTIPTTQDQLSENHTRFENLLFQTKVALHTTLRLVKNFTSPSTRAEKSKKLIDAPLVSQSKSLLWNKNDTSKNWILTAGKIQNLRIAAQAIHGLEIPASEVFSFWKHIGNPNIGKGYVTGREIREGCLVPTKGGGLCQLSNALYDAALKANFEIIERHRHSKVVKGSLAEQNRDATVKWNYVDLRFKSTNDFRIEATLTANELIVNFKSLSASKEAVAPVKNTMVDHLNDCFSCGNLKCVKHTLKTHQNPVTSNTAYLIDFDRNEVWDYVHQNIAHDDTIITNLSKKIDVSANVKRLKTNLLQQFSQRLKRVKNVFKGQLQQNKKLAERMSKLIPLEATHLIVSQNLVPYLSQAGVLGGRTFDIIMSRQPLEQIHKKLDYAHQLHPKSETLNDFRADDKLIAEENSVLEKANRIITSHTKVLEQFPLKSVWLDINLIKKPRPQSKQRIVPNVLLAGSAVARKGIFEILKLKVVYDFNLFVTGKATEHVGLLEKHGILPFDGDYSQIDLIVSPAYVDNHPKVVLEGLACEIPTIATFECGLKISQSDQLQLIPRGDYDALKIAFEKALMSTNRLRLKSNVTPSFGVLKFA